MADETTAAEAENNDAAENAGGEQEQKDQQQDKTDPEIEQIASQANDPDAVRNALRAERTAAKEARDLANELAAKVKEFEDRDKSEQQKKDEALQSAEGRATAAEGKLVRFEVATAKKLPLELADRLQGKNKKELEADADRLLELVGTNDTSGDSDAGKGAGAEGSTFNDEIRRKAGRST